MSMAPDRRVPPAVQDSIPTFCVNADEAAAAYTAYSALRITALGDPRLLDNPYFIALQDTAYARFHLLFEAL